MAISDETQWSQLDASLLTMLSLNTGASRLGELLLCCSDVGLEQSWDSFVESISRLIAAGLVICSAELFFVTSAGRAISPERGDSRYFKDLFEEARLALNERAHCGKPDALELSREEFDQALAYVAHVKELRRTRRGASGFKKWAHWDDAPPLTFGDCIEFLTCCEGRGIVVKVENATDSVRFVGTLGPPLAPSPDAHDGKSIIFPVQTVDAHASAERLVLTPGSFATATYH